MFCKNGNMYMANNSSILQYCHGMLISSSTTQQSFVDLSMQISRGGLNCEAKVQVLVVTPPLLFLEVGCKILPPQLCLLNNVYILYCPAVTLPFLIAKSCTEKGSVSLGSN